MLIRHPTRGEEMRFVAEPDENWTGRWGEPG
jgi:hypothetical protein